MEDVCALLDGHVVQTPNRRSRHLVHVLGQLARVEH